MSTLHAFHLVVVIFGAVSIGHVNSQIFKSGPCPDVPVMKDFSTGKYAGRWYEIEKSYAFYEAGLRCIASDYTDRNGGLGIVNRGVFQLTNAPSTIQGSASPVNAAEPAKLVVRLLGIPIPANYWVLDTDYEKYSIVWSCTNLLFGVAHAENLWILSRNRELDNAIRQNIYVKMDLMSVDRSRLQSTDQTNCSN